MQDISGRLSTQNYEIAVMLAELPEHIRGFGPVREVSFKAAREEQEKLVAQFDAADSAPTVRAEGFAAQNMNL